MAITSFTPYPVPTDLMPLAAIRDQLELTGHPVSISTIRRWIEAEGLYTVRRRSRQGWRRDYVSYSDILLAHRDWVSAGQA